MSNGKLYNVFDKKTEKYIATRYEPFQWSDQLYEVAKEENLPVLKGDSKATEKLKEENKQLQETIDDLLNLVEKLESELFESNCHHKDW